MPTHASDDTEFLLMMLFGMAIAQYLFDTWTRGQNYEQSLYDREFDMIKAANGE